MKFKLVDAIRSYMPLRTDHKMKFYVPIHGDRINLRSLHPSQNQITDQLSWKLGRRSILRVQRQRRHTCHIY